MALSGQRFTVSTTALALDVSDSGGGRLFIRNTDATNTVDLGFSNVTAGTGYPLKAGEVLGPLEINSGEVVYAIRSAAADVVVAVLRT